MKYRVIWALGVVLFLFSAILMSRRRGDPPPKIRDISGGAVVQRQRIDRAISTAGRLNVDEAISSLSQNGETFGLLLLARSSPASMGDCFMKGILADRRISKIFEHLSSIPAKEAEMRSQKIFADHFAMLHERWKEWRNTRLKERGATPDSLPLTDAPHHAASAGLFFCSYFCSREILDAKIKYWNDTLGSQEFESLEGIQIYSPSRNIDPLFLLNLLVISGHRHQRSTSQLNTELQSLCRKVTGGEKAFLQVTQMKMFKWSAETSDTDFTHVTRGIPASGNSVLLELPGFADPNSSPVLTLSNVAKVCESCIRTWRDR